MILKSIKLNNYKQFEGNNEFSFDKITFVRGRNGVGKTHLARKSILFALYGYRGNDSLEELPTKNKFSKCKVEIELIKNDDKYRIIRKVPSEVQVYKNDTLIEFKEQNTTEAKIYISSIFKDQDYFKKFRLVDSYDSDVNFLKSGNTTIQKILFSFYENKINSIRERLLKEKRTQENLNINRVVFKHYPSLKRQELINRGLRIVNEKNQRLETVLITLDEKRDILINEISTLKERIRYYEDHIKRINEKQECPTCWQTITDKAKTKIINNRNQKITEIKDTLTVLTVKKEEIVKKWQHRKNLLNKYTQRENRLTSLQTKLEARMSQKEYIYSNKDILITKQSINELDSFASFYLSKSLDILKPIINSVLEKIKYTVNFVYTDKGELDIVLKDDRNTEWRYKDLSSGQELMLQIAFKIALLLERGENGLLIADEGLGSLDTENLIHIISIIESSPFQLIFILHNFENIPSNVKVIDLNKEKN